MKDLGSLSDDGEHDNLSYEKHVTIRGMRIPAILLAAYAS